MGVGSFTDHRAVRIAAGVVAVLVLAPFVVYAVPGVVGAEGSYVVLSSSMRPSINAGDFVFVNEVPAERIAKGDVITYEPPTGHRQADANTVTHQVVEVVERDDGRYFRTKGDANEEPDQVLVPASNVEGRVMLVIPLIGRIIAFAGTPAGIALLVVVPAVLLVVTELRDLWLAATREE